MICYDHKEIQIKIGVNCSEIIYQDKHYRSRTFIKRKVNVCVKILTCELFEGDLSELYFVKAAIQVFLQSYWRKTTKNGLLKIDLDKTLIRNNCREELRFTARQHQKKHFLEILFHGSRHDSEKKVYLDYHDAIMLDGALHKAISMLSPEQTFGEERE